MSPLIKVVFFFVLICLIHVKVYGQNLENRDITEIKSRSVQLINEFESLLNLISNKDIFPSEIEQVIQNSYQNSVNRLFKSRNVIIESDLDINSDSYKNAKNIDINTYLRNFDLTYQKSEEQTVSLEIVQISEIEQKDYVFLKIYFKRSFRGINIVSQGHYIEVGRLAEIEVEKDSNGRWRPLIVGVRFGTPDSKVIISKNVTNPTVNQVKLPPAMGEVNVLDEINQSDFTDTNFTFYEKQNENETNVETIAILAIADQAFKDKFYEKALNDYKRAQEISPYNSYISVMITRSQQFLDELRQKSQQQRFEYYNTLGQNLMNKGKIADALDVLQIAYNLSYSPQLQEKISRLANRLAERKIVDSILLTNNPQDALKELKKQSRRNSSSAEFLLGLAKINWIIAKDRSNIKSSEIKESLNYIRQSLNLDPVFSDAHELNSQIFETTGEIFSALTTYNKLMEINPIESKYFFKSALLFYQIGNERVAETNAKLAVALNPRDPDINFLLGRILFEKNDFNQAANYLSEAIKFESDNPEYYLLYGKILKYINPSDAVNNLERYYELSSDVESAKIQIINESNSFLDLATDYQKDIISSNRLELFNLSIRLYEGNVAAWFERGKFLINYGDLKLAEESFKQAIELNREDPEIYFALLELLTSQKRFNDVFLIAEPLIQTLVEKFGSLLGAPVIRFEILKAVKILGQAHENLGNYPEALNVYLFGQNYQPDGVPDLHLLAGKVHLEWLKNFDEALKEFNIAVKVSSNAPEALFFRGKTYYYLGLTQRRSNFLKNSIDDLVEVRKTRFMHAEVAYFLAKNFELLKDYQSAKVYFLEAISLEPGNQQAWYDLSLVCLFTNDAERGLESLANFERLNPNNLNADFYYRRAFFLKLINETELARTYLEKVIDLDPSNGMALFKMASIYYFGNMKDKAYEYFSMAYSAKVVLNQEMLESDQDFSFLIKDKVISRLHRQRFR